MTYESTVRTKLQSKVFAKIGKTVTFKSVNTPVYNSRGEVEATTYSSSSVTIVPYNIVNARESHEAFGDIQEGEMDAAVPYTVTVAVNDIFTIESQDYIVKQVEPNYLPGNVVTIIRLAKIQN